MAAARRASSPPTPAAGAARRQPAPADGGPCAVASPLRCSSRFGATAFGRQYGPLGAVARAPFTAVRPISRYCPPNWNALRHGRSSCVFTSGTPPPSGSATVTAPRTSTGATAVQFTKMIARPCLERPCPTRGAGMGGRPGCDQRRRRRRCGGRTVSARRAPGQRAREPGCEQRRVHHPPLVRRGPDAPVLLPTGLRFDVLTSAGCGDDALTVFMTGYHRPVARTVGAGCALGAPRPGCPPSPAGQPCRTPRRAALSQPWRVRAGPPSPAPPGCSRRAVHAPTLPHSADILPAVVAACRDPAATTNPRVTMPCKGGISVA